MTITARQVAADVLHRSREREAFAAELVDDALTAASLSPQDRRFVTQLVFGVLRRAGTLDALLKPFIRIPFHAVQPRVWDVLRLGAFQLTFLTHVPKHAAVNETVELANHIGAPKAKGFVNGVMRRVAELVTDEFTATAARDTVPFEWVGLPPPAFSVAPAGSERGPAFSSAPRAPQRGPTPPTPLPEQEGVAGGTRGGGPLTDGRGGHARETSRESVESTGRRRSSSDFPYSAEVAPDGPPLPSGRGAGGVGSTSAPRGATEKTAPTATPRGAPEKSSPTSAPRYRRLTRPILPDPVAEPAAYFAAGFSFPQWLANRWFARFGAEECTRLGFWFNAPPPLWIRVNKLNASRESYRIQLAAALIAAEPGEHPQSLRFPEHHLVRDLPGYAEGDFAVQDHSSMLVASALGVHPKMRVLDLCAAPGGKTTHLAELMDNRGSITACDLDAKRLETVTALCQRLRARGVETVLVKEDSGIPDGPFDAALVDVPCSNTGVLGRRPEVRWRLKPNEFEYLVRLQTRLLIEALARVKPGGAAVYSTCSIEPEENEGVVRAVCQGMRGVTLEAEHHAIPGHPSDGGYWARLRKPKGK